MFAVQPRHIFTIETSSMSLAKPKEPFGGLVSTKLYGQRARILQTPVLVPECQFFWQLYNNVNRLSYKIGGTGSVR